MNSSWPGQTGGTLHCGARARTRAAGGATVREAARDGRARAAGRRSAFAGERDADREVEPVLLDRLAQHLRLHLAALDELGQDGKRDRLRVHMEEPAAGGPGVGEPVPVGTE